MNKEKPLIPHALSYINTSANGFKEQNERYNGMLSVWLSEGSLIKIKEGYFMSKTHYLTIRKWLSTYENLGGHLLIDLEGKDKPPYFYNYEDPKDYKQRKIIQYKNNLSKYTELNKNNPIHSILNLFIKALFEQPQILIEATIKKPNDFNEYSLTYWKFDFIHSRVNFYTGKINEYIYSARNSILSDISNNSDQFKTMSKEILLFTENLINFEIAESFYKVTHSPIFICYFSFIESLIGYYEMYFEKNITLTNINRYSKWYKKNKDIYSIIQLGINEESIAKCKTQSDKKHKEQFFSFNCKLTKGQLGKLYSELNNSLNFIDDTKTSQEDFINVFTKDLTTHDSKIYFRSETTQIAFLFSLIENNFKTLNLNVESSNRFFTKKGNVLKSGNISAQLSKTTNRGITVKNEEIIKEIVKESLQKS